jgi:hypothetical protein
MNLPGPEHLIFIPLVLMMGMVCGYIMGSRAAAQNADQRRRRSRE